MGWKFYGYGAVYGSPDTHCDILLQGCFTAFLSKTDVSTIPLTNGHGGPVVGKWLRMFEDGFGLFVIGELDGTAELPGPPFAGLSVTPVNAQGSPYPNPWGGKTCRFGDIAEISLVETPAHPGARVMGPWTSV
ncbi:hypothetical protein EJ069_10370 [Mesorhizobium sp. M2A.F.Ca.ET.043.05.1.1]|uniref:hypothetical protein n=1 Tax=Mesorhizobium sp. M2A.F.Ca.ET.043.05.1.1 TaxID=2493671 RepID=UPI000F753FFB|nr:hypothetical protein [Mesorhizobium sp. M2A.F.Ca.ET.043.05.1.1]AZO15099.1 hypothetical protein EJ069_10370 [Mesorhizobium sp. M2A.F.Ca.ET.043.05.1.1]